MQMAKKKINYQRLAFVDDLIDEVNISFDNLIDDSKVYEYDTIQELVFQREFQNQNLYETYENEFTEVNHAIISHCEYIVDTLQGDMLDLAEDINEKLKEHNLKVFSVKDDLQRIFDNDLMNVLDEYFTNKGQFMKYRELQDALEQLNELEIE